MTEDEFKNLMVNVRASHNKGESGYNYAGYGIVENLAMSNAELKAAHAIIWDLIMVCTKEQRDSKYLFSHGVLKSKEIFLERKAKMTDEMTPFHKDMFAKDALIFQKKLENLKPLVDYLIKLKVVL